MAVEFRREAGVQRRAFRPELQHVADHGDAPAARAGLGRAEQRQRGAHRGGIGVVALVDQRERRRRAPASVKRSPRPLAGAKAAKRLGAARKRRAERVRAPAARRPRSPPCVCPGAPRSKAMRSPAISAAIREPSPSRLAGDAAAPRRRRSTPKLSTSQAARSRRRGEALELRRVAVEDRRAARLDAGEDLRLGVGDRLDRAEMLDMHRRDRGDERDMRAHEADERRDLAGVVHADLEHAEGRVGRQARERQRHAPMIVERRGRGVRRRRSPTAPARAISLALVLPTEPVIGEDSCRAAPPRGFARAAPCRAACRRRRTAGRPPAIGRETSAADGAGLEGARDVVVAVVRVALDGDEQVAGLERARVDRDAGRGPFERRGRRPRAPAPSSFGVQSGRVMRRSPAPPALSSASENGSTRSPTIWPVSWPLPAMTSASPGSSSLTPSRIASARSPISRAPGAPARIAARIAAGFSERGLSSVTMTTSAARAAIAPIIGRLPGSRSPPQPKTTMSRPVTNGRSAASAFSSASGLCA